MQNFLVIPHLPALVNYVMPCTGTATLPLHYGKAPSWLFCRMTMLARFYEVSPTLFTNI